MSHPDESKFIDGVYNYCDRWCERCTLTHQCRLFSMEQENIQRHIAHGRHPRSWEALTEDLQMGFQKALDMLRAYAEEEGIDLDEIAIDPEDDDSPDPDEHPMSMLADRYAQEARDLLKELSEYTPEEPEDDILGDTLPVTWNEPKDEITDSFEVISWYHAMIYVKINRALGSLIDARFEDAEMAVVSRRDADGSAKVAHEGLVKSLSALQKVYNECPDLQDLALTLMVKADRLKKDLVKEIPGLMTFRRPGLDDRGAVLNSPNRSQRSRMLCHTMERLSWLQTR